MMRMDLAAKSDVAKVGYGQDDVVDGEDGANGAVLHTVAVVPRPDGDIDAVGCVEAIAKMYGNARRNDGDDDDSDGEGVQEEADMMDIDNAGAHAPMRLRNVTVQREPTPMNEFGSNRELIRACFRPSFS